VLNPSTLTPRNGWVLYDAECGFCSRWLKFWTPTLSRHGFCVGALQDEWVADKLHLTAEELLADIRLITSQGRLFSGADVYLQVTRKIWWAWPFYALFSLPGFNCLIQLSYRWFARNRYCVSRACALRPEQHGLSQSKANESGPRS
jgi:predicted DCC family thiol-disulfide oxidoreductase YuxK